jgi:glycerophosphoryl diester phosphodiesterase
MVAVHGHRGARAVLPGNTLAGFLYAIEAGCDAIELDVLATRDDVLVVCHDPVLKRRVIREQTLEELRIPTLREVLELAPATRLAALYQFGARDFVSIAHDAGAETVAPYHRLVTARKVAAAHRAGIQVVPWTANRPRDWKRLVRAGVDGIITDNPAALIEYLRSFTLSCRPPEGAG